MSYHNTTSQTGAKLKEYKEKAKQQDNLILDIFMCYISLTFTAIQMYNVANKMQKLKESSCRRSITNLQKAGFLIKSKDKVKCVSGRTVHYWQFNEKL